VSPPARTRCASSSSALSKQLTTLADAGYVEIRKAFVGKRPRTSARLTTGGRTAFDTVRLAVGA
jgi:DNA-binding HxlR family transcriptional regulator